MIDNFSGKYRFLSNFYPHAITWEEIRYPSTEHAYQAAKTTNIFIRQIMAKERSPRAVKKLGRTLILRSDWESIKLDIMLEICRIKFTDPALRQKLIETYPCILVEGNWWGDTFWGVCNGHGTNHLGKTLMRIRKEIMNGTTEL